jgi:outer membrane murein-binding lipoprotein Lpp
MKKQGIILIAAIVAILGFAGCQSQTVDANATEVNETNVTEVNATEANETNVSK